MDNPAGVIVGYWGFRARVGPIRHLLAFCGIPFTNRSYIDRSDWFDKDKKELEFDFPNLPYLIDEEKKITQTKAILKYIALKANKRELIGDTDDKYIQVETALYALDDLRNALYSVIWTSGDFVAEKEAAFTKGEVKEKLDVVNKALTGKEWITGFFSIADFMLFEIIDLINDMDPARLEPYPSFVHHYERFLEFPQTKAHRESLGFVKKWFPPGKTQWNSP